MWLESKRGTGKLSKSIFLPLKFKSLASSRAGSSATSPELFMSASSPIRAPKSMILGHSYIKLRFRIEKVNVIRTNPTLFLFLLKGTKPRWHRIGWWTFPRVRSFRIWSRKHSVRAGSCQWNRYSLISPEEKVWNIPFLMKLLKGGIECYPYLRLFPKALIE